MTYNRRLKSSNKKMWCVTIEDFIGKIAFVQIFNF